MWKLIRLPNKTQIDRAWTGALILVMLVFVLFVTARLVARRGTQASRRNPMTTLLSDTESNGAVRAFARLQQPGRAPRHRT